MTLDGEAMSSDCSLLTNRPPQAAATAPRGTARCRGACCSTVTALWLHDFPAANAGTREAESSPSCWWSRVSGVRDRASGGVEVISYFRFPKRPLCRGQGVTTLPVLWDESDQLTGQDLQALGPSESFR